MKKLFEEPSFYIIAYLLGIVITFGDAYHRIPDTETRSFAGQSYTIENSAGIKSVGAFLSSIAWPLYWSVQAHR